MTCKCLTNARTTDDLKSGWVEDAVGDGLAKSFSVCLTSDNLLGDGIGRQLEPFVGARTAIPFAVSYNAVFRNTFFVVDEIILRDDPPSKGEGACGAPVHASKPCPVQRHARRRNDMTIGVELREERALDHVPVAVEPSLDQRGTAAGTKPVDVAGVIVEKLRIIRNLRGDEDADQVGLGILDWLVRAVVDDPVLDPVMAGTAGVAGGAELAACTARRP